MKTYIVKFNSADFVSTDSTETPTHYWRTPVIDLYANSQYTNYSVRRDPHGTDFLGSGIYTGLNELSPTESEIGYVDGGRFVDTSGRVDIVGWIVDVASSNPSFTTPTYSLSVFHSPDNIAPPYAHATPSLITDWARQEDILEGSDVMLIRSNRYVYFELKINSVVDLAEFNIDLYVSIDISSPVVNGLFSQTPALLSKFPEWMELNEFDPQNPNYENIATPSTLGGKLLNSVAGEWLTDLDAKIRYQEAQYYIETVDVGQRAWVYRSNGLLDIILTITGDGIQLARVSSVQEFYDSQDDDNACYWNRNTNELYTTVQYTNLLINGEKVEQEPYQIWNSIDDIGITVDLFRLFKEENDSFRKRILDVFVNKPGVSLDNFKKAIRRELNLWQFEGATPDSEYLGATPEVLELSDLKNESKYFDDRSFAKKPFKNLITHLAKKYPLTWGYFRFGEAFWDPDGVRRLGFDYLPRLADATPVTGRRFDSGVGDGNDLFVFRPDVITGEIDFETNLKIRGRSRTNRTEHLPLVFNVAVYGVSNLEVYSNPTKIFNFVIELTVGSDVYFSNVAVTVTSDVDYDQATPTAESLAFVEWFTVDGFTDAGFNFYNKVTGDGYYQDVNQATPTGEFTTRIDLSTVSSVTIKRGSYDVDLATYTDAPLNADFKLWFTDIPNTYIGNDVGTDLTRAGYNPASHICSFYVESLAIQNDGIVADGYESDQFIYSITLNNNFPPTTTKDFVLNLPNISWPDNTSTRAIRVEVLTSNGQERGAWADFNAATPMFVDHTYIRVNGNSTWVDGEHKDFAASTTQITFSSNSGAAYPITIPVWSLFEASMTTPVEAKVDNNGPWRDNQKLPANNTNYILKYFNNLTRADFGLPNDENYIITWIGIDTISSNQVIVWLDGNTVKPAVSYGGETVETFAYPENSVIETYNQGSNTYSLSAFPIYAKIKPGANEKWLPKVHSGWLNDSGQEYFIYARPSTVSTVTSSATLPTLIQQGAPVTVYGLTGSEKVYTLRQTHSFELDESSTPTGKPVLSHIHKEIIMGNGTQALYTAYSDIYNIVVENVTHNYAIGVSSTSATNKIDLGSVFDADHEFIVSYRVRNSFYIDNNYEDVDGKIKAFVSFDVAPGTLSLDSYEIIYESSIYDPATPVDVPLNTMYTTIDNGFVYIDHQEYPLSTIQVVFDPAEILADGDDYGLISIFTYDKNGNPKPNQTVSLWTNFGEINTSSVTTDENGYGSAILLSELWDGSLNPSPATPALLAPDGSNGFLGQVLASSSGISAITTFKVQVLKEKTNRIIATLESQIIAANGESAASIVGKVEDQNKVPIVDAKVYWRKGRSIYNVLAVKAWEEESATPGSSLESGYVVTDPNGRFNISPFISSEEPGYWFVAVECNGTLGSPSSFPLIGDIVSWYEYPDINSAIDPITNLPTRNNQDATPYWEIPNYSYGSAFPVSFDEQDYLDPAQSSTPQWVPPIWYAIDRYRQYQMGLYGQDYYVTGATPSNPDYKEF